MRKFNLVALALALFAACALPSPAPAGPLWITRGRAAYPPAIVNAGLQREWDLIGANPGPRTALTNVTSYAPPTGVAYDGTGHALNISATADVGSVDMAGNSLFALNDGAVATVHDVRLNSPYGFVAMSGQTSGGGAAGNPTLSISYCTVDLTGANSGNAGPLNSASTQAVSYDHCTFRNAPRDYMVFGTVNVSWSYFALMGQNTDFTDHLEYIHWLGSGGGLISHTVFNAADGVPSLGGFSGAFQIQSDNAAITDLVFDHVVIIGSKVAVSHYGAGPSVGLPAFSLKAVNFDVTIHVGHSVVQSDPTGRYWVPSVANGHHVRIIDDGGNYDFDTGNPLDLTNFL